MAFVDADMSQTLRAIDPALLGRRIRELRVSRGMTQGQLASGAASTAYVSRIESGLRRPDITVLEGLAANLGVTAADLLFDNEVRAPQALARLELDYADLELATGSPERALAHLDALPEVSDRGIHQLATLLRALVNERLGHDPIDELQQLASQDIVSDDVWFRTHVALCRALREIGDTGSAIEAGEAAIARLKDRGLEGTDQAVQLAVSLAGVYIISDEIPKALRMCRAALKDAEKLGSPTAQAYAYWNASVCESKAGNIDSALELAQRAHTLIGVDGDVRHRAMLRANVGALMLMTNSPDVAEALAELDQASTELEVSGATASEIARTQVERARALMLTGEVETALATVIEVLNDRTGLSPFLLADALVLRGRLMWTLGIDDAATHYQEAVLVLSSTGQDRAVARLWYDIAARFEEVGDAAAALDAYRRAGVASGIASSTRMEQILR